MLAAIWGVESNFGDGDGQAAAGAVAVDARLLRRTRPAYFRCELMATLKIVDRGDIPAREARRLLGGRVRPDAVHALDLLRLAVDLDGDGRRDIVDSAADALGSTANYFAKSGWRSGVPWGFEVKLPPGYSGPSGRKAKQPMSAWAARGITRIDGRPLGDGRRRPAAAGRRRRARPFW